METRYEGIGYYLTGTEERHELSELGEWGMAGKWNKLVNEW
jgi:hypothetical protein